MTQGSRLRQVDILGVPVNACTMVDAVNEVAHWVQRREPGFATFTGVHGGLESQRRPEVLAAHHAARFVGADGMPLVWASRRAGIRGAERVYGPDFLLAFLERAEAEGWSSFFYGGKEGVPERLMECLRARYPALRVAGTFSPPFRALTVEEDATACSMIDASGADIVWVGMSTPKQELWMADRGSYRVRPRDAEREPLAIISRHAGPPATIDLGSAHPLPDGLS
jgi:N-acetylglucosaminyldiphosphoundecaprenol N-acetyl-beta-D-mannosaminyltransferase